ncbi:Uncharacterised protein [Yersinia rohdei]|uniref:Uncharacterized protein n=1 Tax=Yersinia rohdei TaxID=29485 RepID=A0A0U1HWH7_YERRO|nr:Uncharacterised protein [Yersinia rohdei]CQI94283.1 Uncharacterised protein [Yersinia rohdei]
MSSYNNKFDLSRIVYYAFALLSSSLARSTITYKYNLDQNIMKALGLTVKQLAVDGAK